MKNYTVNFLIKDIISVKVSAEDDKQAEEKANKIMDKEMYKSKVISCIDGKTEFAGINIDDVWEEIENE